MKFIPQSVTMSVGRKVLATKKNSPHIFFAGGVVGVFASTVLACRATLKLEETVDEIQHDLESVKDMGQTSREKETPYSEQEYYKDLVYVYGKSAVKLGRLYGPSLAVGAISIAALTGSHIQLTRRNTALTAAFATISKAYDEYRVRVQEEIGVEREHSIYADLQKEEATDENGKKKVVKVVGQNGLSPYARLFEESNANWWKNPEINRNFIQCQQNYANHKLRSRGHVFLNEVYDSLGLERSHEGQVVGWVMDGEGDDFIDFGLNDPHSVRFVNGEECNVWLDFNVDGVVYDKF